MATSHVLTSQRLDLHPFNSGFLTERYVGWLNDETTTRFSEQRHRGHTLQSCRAYFDSFTDTPHYFWAIVAHNASLGHIGNMTATIDMPNRVADLAIMIGESAARGQGYGLEAWTRACRFLLNEAKMRKVTAGTMAINEPMLRIMKTAGMVEEGRKKKQFLVDGAEVDGIYMALSAS
jgi:ribosomal-protein-alanine N-acetyltransferase